MASRMLSRALKGCMPLRTIQGQQTRNMSAAASASQAATKGAGETQSHDQSQSQSGGDINIARQHQSQAPQQRQRGLGRRASYDSLLPMMPGGLLDLWSPMSSSRSMRQMMDSMNRLMDMDFFPSESAAMRGTSGLRTPWDIVEKDNSYYMRIDVPGFEKNDVKIHVEDDELVIQAEKKVEEDDVFGLQRSVNTRMLLPQEAVKDKIKAELKNGVLTVVVPKEQVPEDKKHVQVNIE